MKNLILRYLLFCCCFCIPSVFAEDATPADQKTVFLIPVRQAIFHPQLYLLRRGVEKAVEADADAIILLMDTPGGSVKIMQEMVNPIIDVGIPTYTLVESEAISAGAIIAMATDQIYMTPRSTIGDAMPVIMGQGGYEELGEAEREKIESYMDAIARSIAQAKGRNETLIRAMVRRSVEFKLEDGTVISPEGNILTLTNQEAELLLPDGTRLLSEGTVADLEEMLEILGLENAELIELIPSMADDLALLITKLAPILMTLALLLVYLEIQSPGIGWAGGGAALLFIVVTFGHNVAGLAGFEDLVFIALGIALLLVELFVLPGFGIAGISGILLLGWGLLQSMTIRYPGNPGDLPGLDNIGNLGPAITTLGLAVIGSTLLAALLLKSMGEKSLLGKRLILSEAIQPASQEESTLSLKGLIGQQGIALTPLRPAGTVQLNGKNYDAIADGDYVEPQSRIQIQDVHNHRLLVTATMESPA